MKISVVMATYNGEKYIVEQLDSLKNQTRKIDEVIICDDVSSDGTVGIVEDYIKRNHLENEWKLYINEKNMGYADNFINASKKATGEIIFFCDQDDIWLADKVEFMSEIMNKNKDIKLLSSKYDSFVGDVNNVNGDIKYSNSVTKLMFNKKNVFLAEPGCCMAVRGDAFEYMLKYWHFGWAQDDFVWKMALCMDGSYILDRSTMLRRFHNGNTSGKKIKNREARVTCLKLLKCIYESMYDCAEDLNLEVKIMNIIERYIKSTELRIGLFEGRYGNFFRLGLFYMDTYSYKRSCLVELLISMGVRV